MHDIIYRSRDTPRVTKGSPVLGLIVETQPLTINLHFTQPQKVHSPFFGSFVYPRCGCDKLKKGCNSACIKMLYSNQDWTKRNHTQSESFSRNEFSDGRDSCIHKKNLTRTACKLRKQVERFWPLFARFIKTRSCSPCLSLDSILFLHKLLLRFFFMNSIEGPRVWSEYHGFRACKNWLSLH